MKAGKTTAVSMLNNNLLIDLENGSYFLTCMKMQARTVQDLSEIATAIKKKTQEDGQPPYKYVTIDNGTVLEDIALNLGAQLYRATPMGKNWDGDDLRKLPNGAGFLYIRLAYIKIIDSFRAIVPHLILICHTKDTMISKEGKELTEMSLDLTGKLARLISADADAIAYMHREKNETKLNFKSGDDMIVGSRADHLRDKEIVLLESDEEGKLSAHWDRIFRDNV